MNLLAVLVCVLVQSVLAQRYPHPVCAPHFQYVHLNSKLGWVGLGSTTYLESSSLHNITLEVTYATVELEDYSNLGELEITHFHQLRTFKTDERQWNVLYIVKFSTQNPIPDVIKTVLNGVTLCEDKERALSSQKPVHIRLQLTYNGFTNQQKFIAKVLTEPQHTSTTTKAPPSENQILEMSGPFTVRQLTNRKVFLSKEWLNWYEAKEFCHNHNLTLATIRSEMEDKELNKFHRDALPGDGDRGFWIWIGGSKLTGDWLWLGKDPITYFNWGVGEPNNQSDNESCLMVWVKYNNDTWNDSICKVALPFVCEKRN
ncbi:aggrecan core protein-like [Lutzomyia longipalpis]|uniref:aggrecan core protein-like n=1 Tax=Lutzomyia longipalpis TaxID=7200 RepID=UPI002484383F|nr:aggrecan core protein-like [Lutzomyia longipalpis]